MMRDFAAQVKPSNLSLFHLVTAFRVIYTPVFSVISVISLKKKYLDLFQLNGSAGCNLWS
jgi:hypothetical protein